MAGALRQRKPLKSLEEIKMVRAGLREMCASRISITR